MIIIDSDNLIMRIIFTKGIDPKDYIKSIIGSILKLSKDFQNDLILCCFDSTGSKYRKTIYPEYKANRLKKKIEDPRIGKYKDPLKQQLLGLLPTLGILSIQALDIESDDIISSLVSKYKDRHEIIIVSADEDYFQLLEENISVYNGTKNTLFNLDYLEDKLEVHRKHVPLVCLLAKCLQGDVSDNIIGIKGIGDVKGTQLAKRIINKEVDEKDKLLLKKNSEVIKLNKNLIDFNRLPDEYKKKIEYYITSSINKMNEILKIEYYMQHCDILNIPVSRVSRWIFEYERHISN